MDKFRTRRRQRGLSIIGLIFIGLIVVGLLALGFRTVPAVIEYIAIERAVQKIKGEATTVPEIRAAFDRHATIDDITSIEARIWTSRKRAIRSSSATPTRRRFRSSTTCPS